MMNLETAVEQCQAGDPAARRSLYLLCADRVYRHMVRMVGVQDAADVTQQVFLRVFEKIDTFRRLARFETWLFRLAANEAYQYLRREKRWKHQPLELEPPDPRSSQTDSAESKLLLEKAIQQLDVELRSIFLLKEVEGLSYQEIASVLNIPEGTVASRLSRARRELRTLLGDLGWELPQ